MTDIIFYYKITAICLTFLCASSGLYIAYRLNTKQFKSRNYFMAFTAGILLSSSFTHLLPSAIKKFNIIFQNNSDSFYASFPCAEFLMGIAFVFLVLIEEIAIKCLPQKPAVEHRPPSCTAYRAQFAVLPRKEMKAQEDDGCCPLGDEGQTCVIQRKYSTLSTSQHGCATISIKSNLCQIHSHNDYKCLHEESPSFLDKIKEQSNFMSSDQCHYQMNKIRQNKDKLIAILSDIISEIGGFSIFIAMSIHSVIEGLGLGASENMGDVLTNLIAILSHKLLAAISLGMCMNEKFSNKTCHDCHGSTSSSLGEPLLSDRDPIDSLSLITATRRRFLIYAVFFALATPFGAIIGMEVTNATDYKTSLSAAIFTALGAGTFLQVGCMELLPRALIGSIGVVLKSILFTSGFIIMSIISVYV